MSYSLTTMIEPEFVRVTLTGEFSVGDAYDVIDALKAEADRSKCRRLLVDSSAYAGPMTDVDRFDSGRRYAEVFGPGIKTAFIFPLDFITKMGELAAVNRGAKLLVTPSEIEALDWLLG